MKTNKTTSPIRLVIGAITVLIFLAVSGCSRKISFSTSSVVPAALGSVKVKKDHNGNHAIEINVKHLVEATRLQPPRDLYLVWMDTDDNGIKNIGQLRSSGSLFSKTRKGSLKAVSAFRPVRVFITAENDSEIRYPGSLVVLTTRYFGR